MTTNSMLLSLGHNSSAILLVDDEVVGGYETERFTGVKSDSTFPAEPIRSLLDRHKPTGPVDFYVSHWDLFGAAANMKAKHWDPKFVSDVANGGRLFETNEYFTHHDAHAWSALAFAGKGFPQANTDNSFLFVMDGFGTFGEHMSFYRLIDGIPVLLERKFGFGGSLGLLYQYTTAFVGLKQNQDEYKLLAYEAHIEKYDTILKKLDELVEDFAGMYINRVSGYMERDKTDPLLNLAALPNVAMSVANMLGAVIKGLEIEFDEKGRRIVCAYFTQRIVEEVVAMFVHKYNPSNIVLVGGLFYNVKLNNAVSKLVPGLTCIMPLAGDQGAAIGVHKAINPDFKWPDHLFWGQRNLDKRYFDHPEMKEADLLYFNDPDAAFEEVRERLRIHGMVNIVRGSMEYGPRALCHTSTIALPEPDIAADINHLNDRTNEMPFAPIMTAEQADYFLEDCDKIHESLKYMICTRDIRADLVKDIRGCAHRYPRQGKYSARPQITNDPHIVKLLDEFGPLINTSFNYHGVPIVNTNDQIRHSHMMERARSGSKGKPTTIVIGDKHHDDAGN